MKAILKFCSTPAGKVTLLVAYCMMLAGWYFDFRAPDTEAWMRSGFYAGAFADVLLLGMFLGLGGGAIAAWALPKRGG